MPIANLDVDVQCEVSGTEPSTTAGPPELTTIPDTTSQPEPSTKSTLRKTTTHQKLQYTTSHSSQENTSDNSVFGMDADTGESSVTIGKLLVFSHTHTCR